MEIVACLRLRCLPIRSDCGGKSSATWPRVWTASPEQSGLIVMQRVDMLLATIVLHSPTAILT